MGQHSFHTSNINNKRPFSYIEGEVKRNKKRRGEIWDYTYNLREKGEKYEKSSTLDQNENIERTEKKKCTHKFRKEIGVILHKKFSK